LPGTEERSHTRNLLCGDLPNFEENIGFSGLKNCDLISIQPFDFCLESVVLMETMDGEGSELSRGELEVDWDSDSKGRYSLREKDTVR